MTYPNVNIAHKQGGDAYLLGSKAGRQTQHDWDDIQSVYANAGSEDYVGFWDDFLGDLLVDEWAANLSASSTAAISAASGGMVRLSTHTDDNANATLVLGLNWTVSNGWTVFKARVKNVSAITARAVEIGLSDALSESNGQAFTSHDSTVVAVATNAALFGFNADDSMTTFSACSVNADTAAVTTGVGTPSTSYTKYEIRIDSAGNAYFYVDGSLVATHLLAVATTAVLTPWISVTNLTAATARSIDVDYVGIWGARA